MLLNTLLVGLLPLAGLPSQGADESEASVVRAYDLTLLMQGFYETELFQPVFPCVRPQGWQQVAYDDWEMAQEGDWVPDEVMNLVFETLGEELEYEGRYAELGADGRLLLVAPENIQARVAGLLSTLERHTAKLSSIQIDVLSCDLDEGPDVPASVLELGDAVQWIREAATSGVEHRSFRLAARPGGHADVDLTQELSVISEYDVEIAQGSSIGDPIRNVYNVGTRLTARTAAADGGTWLTLLYSGSEVVDDVQTRTLPLQAFVGTEHDAGYIESMQVFQSIDISAKNVVLNSFVPAGKALLLETAVDLEGDAGRQIVVIRAGGGADHAGFELGEGERGMRALNCEAFTPPRLLLDGQLAGAGAGLPVHLGLGYEWWEGLLTAYMVSGMHDDLIALLEYSDEVVGQLGPWVFTRPLGEGGIDGGLGALAPPTELLDLELAVHVGADAREAARLRVPVRVGQDFAAVLGVEGMAIVDHDVEVAQFSSIADPQAELLFDGVIFYVRPTRSTSGELSLDVRARAHVAAGEAERVDLEAPALGSVERVDYDRLFVNQRVEIGGDSGSRRSVTLGDASAGRSDGSISIEVTVN